MSIGWPHLGGRWNFDAENRARRWKIMADFHRFRWTNRSRCVAATLVAGFGPDGMAVTEVKLLSGWKSSLLKDSEFGARGRHVER